MNDTVHYYVESRFSIRHSARRFSRPVARFSDSPWRRESIPRDYAARLIRAARKLATQETP